MKKRVGSEDAAYLCCPNAPQNADKNNSKNKMLSAFCRALKLRRVLFVAARRAANPLAKAQTQD